MSKNPILLIAVPLLLTCSVIFGSLKAQPPEGTTIDKVVAIIGDNIILHSDIEGQYLQYVFQGHTGGLELRCEILEELMFQKMLLVKADEDSIVVSPSRVNAELDRRMRFFVRQIGSEQKLEEYYNKTILELKEELRGSIRNQMVASEVQRKLTADITITPSEVKAYFNQIPEDSIPLIPQQFKMAEITIVPELSHQDKLNIIERLQGIRNRIMDGSSFRVMAGLYSEDPGSANNGGELGMFTRGEMFPEFESAAFNLDVGEVSPIIETPVGFHIIELLERQGDYINARHILLQKKVSPQRLVEAELKADSIRNLIANDTIDFLTAARKFSHTYDETSAGVMINPQTGSIFFSPEQMERDLFRRADRLQEGEISQPYKATTQEGKSGVRILKLVEEKPPHKANLDEDFHRIKTEALEAKKRKALKDWIEKQAQRTYIKLTEERLKGCSFTYKWFE